MQNFRMAEYHYSEFKYIGGAKRQFEHFENYPLKLKKYITLAKDPMNVYHDKVE